MARKKSVDKRKVVDPDTEPGISRLKEGPIENDTIKITGKITDYGLEHKDLRISLYLVPFRGLNDYDKADKLSDLKKETGFIRIADGAPGDEGIYEIPFITDDELKEKFVMGTSLVVYLADKKGVIKGKSNLIEFTGRRLDNDIYGVNVALTSIGPDDIRTNEFSKARSRLDNFLSEIQTDEPLDSNKMAYLLKETGSEPDDVHTMLYAGKYADGLGGLEEGERDDYRELFYGLIKGSNQLVGSRWDSVYSNLVNAKKYLHSAIKYNYIRKELSSKIDDFINHLEDRTAEKVLEEDSEKLPIKKIASLAFSDRNKQKKYLTHKIKHSGDPASFHKKMIKERKFTKKEIEAVEFASDLADLTGAHTPLMEKLKDGDKRTNMSDLLDLSREKLIKTVMSVDLPEDLKKNKTEANEEELKKSYALNIVRGIEARFPSEITLQYAEKKPDLIGSQKASNIITFFNKMKAAKKTFNLREHKITDDAVKDDIKELSPVVIEDIKALQRIMSIAPDIEVSFKLLGKGIKSANQVAALTFKSFMDKFGNDFTSTDEAKGLYNRAAKATKHVENLAVVNSETGSSTVTRMAGTRLITDIPRDYCECEHCRSIYGPAAYFVDLMQFLRNFATGPLDTGDVNQRPLAKLLKRRPDLQHIELSCKNTSTLIPHIDLVNEILEDIMVYGSLEKTDIDGHSDADLHVPHETGESTSEELLATPQHTLSPAYKLLSATKYPASLPYNQPLDTIRTYLGNLKVSRYELMEITKSIPDVIAYFRLTDEEKKVLNKELNAIEAEYIHIDEETFKILTHKDFNEHAVPYALMMFYGYSDDSDFRNNITNVIDFLRRTDIKFTDLIDIVKTTYINPHQHLLNELNEILNPVTTRNLFDTYTHFSTANFEYSIIARIIDGSAAFLEDLPSSFKKPIKDTLKDRVAEFFTAHSSDFDRIITIHQSSDLPKEGRLLDYMSIDFMKKIYTGVEDADYNELFHTTFLKLYKFIKLWKILGWTVEEVDLAISALTHKDEEHFTPELIRKLSAVQQIKDRSKLTVEQILCFWSDINTRGENPLYKKLFLSKSISGLDTGFALDKENNLPADKMESHVIALQAAYRISDADLKLIIKDIGINVSADDSFNIDNLTRIYRYVLLAKGFGISIKELVHIKSLSQIDPFGDWTYEYPMLDFIKQLDLIQSSDFKIAELAKICGLDSSKDIQDDQVTQWIVEAKEQLIKINEEYKGPAEDVILEKKSLIPRFEQAISPQDLDAVLAGFENIETASEAEINQMFDGIFANNWTEPVIPEEAYNGLPTEKQEAYKNSLKNNALYRYILAELNSIIKPVVISDTFYSKMSQLLASDISLLQQFIPSDQITLLTEQISKSGLETSVQTNGGNDVHIIHNYINPPESGSYVMSVQFNSDLNSIEMRFDDLIIPARSVVAGNEITFNAKNLTSDRYYEFQLLSDTGISGNDIELSWKQDDKDKEPANEINLFPADFISAYKTIKDLILGLDRALIFIEGFGLEAYEVSYFQKRKDKFNNIDFLSIGYRHWKRINQYVMLRDVLPVTDKTLLAIFDTAEKELEIIRLLNELMVLMGITPNDAENENALKAQLIEHFKADLDDYPVAAFYLAYATGWNIDDIFELLKHEDLNTDPGSLAILQNEGVAAGFIPKIRMAKALGISIAQLIALGEVITETHPAHPDTFDRLQAVADAVKLAVKSKYDDDSWLGVARQLNDRIRENQQSALVSLLLVRHGMEHPDQLYEYYLLDVQMKSQRETTRIKQAILSIQLFVQRCLMNLENENGIRAYLLNRSRWDWMKNYRVWEANKKVFVTPENWLEPELRPDKSPFFKDLESELMQNDISADTVETALRNYLSRLDEVARLDVCGLYDDTEQSKEYIFARTSNAPYTYYFRTKKYSSECKWESSLWRWSPWEEVKVDIDTIEDGENSWLHLMPVVWKGRLMLFWPVFREKSKSPLEGSKSKPSDMANQAASDIEALKHWEIHLAWSEYKDNKWSKKQISSEFISTEAEAASGSFVNIDDLKEKCDAACKKQAQSMIDCSVAFEDYQIAFKNQGVVPIYFYRKSGAAPDSFTVYISDYSLDETGHYDIKLNDYDVKWKDGNSLTLVENSNVIKLTNSYEIDRYSKCILSVIEKMTNPGKRAAKNWIERLDRFITAKDLAYYDNYSTECDTLIDDYIEKFEDKLAELIEANGNFAELTAEMNQVCNDYYKAKNELEDAGQNIQVRHKQPWEFSFLTNMDENDMLRIDLFGHSIATGFLLSSLHDKPKIHTMAPLNNRSLPNFYNCAKFSNWNGVLDSVDNGMNVVTHNYYFEPYYNFVFQDNNRKYHVGLYPTLLLPSPLEGGGMVPSVFMVRFHNFYHPLVNDFTKRLNQKGVDQFLDLETQQLHKYGTFESEYQPNTSYVYSDYPKENVDFSRSGAYSCYNWELFYHLPMLIATHLSKNNKFKEARDWFHSIFDPTYSEHFFYLIPDPASAAETYEKMRVWRFSPFRSEEEEEDLITDDWRDNPFQPHVYARMRGTEPYKLNVIMKYLDNLIAWGDQHFRRYSMESLGEATQLYVMANLLLGPRPEYIPERGKIKPETYLSIMDDLNANSNVDDLEYELAFPFSGNIEAGVEYASAPGNILGYGTGKYFCIPFNSKLLEYWDIVEQRLFNIRNGLDINGIRRPLPLFEPELDPGMFVAGAASGLSIAGMLGQLNAPIPYYRFSYILQKAIEFCSDIKALGSNLLSAIEKYDSEKLSIMRSSQELDMLNLAKHIKQLQRDESAEALEGLIISRAATVKRMKHYLDLLGIDPEAIPDEEAVELTEIEADVDLSLVEVEGVEGLKLIPMEKEDLDKSKESNDLQIASSSLEILSSAMSLIPNFSADGKFLGIGAGVSIGGSNFGAAISAMSKSIQIAASNLSYSAARASKIGSYFRREQDWVFQANIAGRELIQMNSQLKAARLRLEMAEKELINHDKQIENAEQTDEFLRSKFTNDELYAWMKHRLIDIYKQSFDMAFDLAKRAERSYQFERGEFNANFIQYNYWNSAKEGLLAGESLHLALRQMETSYLDKNKRELEITKNISLLRLNPEELYRFKLTGNCEFELPEALFDLDFPGHYMRRIKSVSITIPCVVGPYTSINCTLRQLRNEIRLVNTAGDYQRNQVGDNRFLVNYASTQSVATSNGQNDSGLFELNFRDERYLPFEGSGVISRWRLEMETAFPQFDYDTISDVILSINYTAREGGETLKTLAREHLATYANAQSGAMSDQGGFFRAFNLKQEFVDGWHTLLTEGESVFNISKEHLPYFSAITDPSPQEIIWFVRSVSGSATLVITINGNEKDILPPAGTTIGDYEFVNVNIADFEFGQDFTLTADKDDIKEIIMIIKYTQ